MRNYSLILVVLCAFFGINFSFAQEDIFKIARTGSVLELQSLFQKNPELLDKKDTNGFTPLILATYNGNLQVANFLIDHTTEINYNAPMGTALMAAVVKQEKDLIQHLLEKNASPNVYDNNGKSALIYASIFKFYEIAALLIHYNADVNHKDSRGNSALDYAILANDDAMIQTLKTKKP